MFVTIGKIYSVNIESQAFLLSWNLTLISICVFSTSLTPLLCYLILNTWLR